jgi:hypothetical protein
MHKSILLWLALGVTVFNYACVESGDPTRMSALRQIYAGTPVYPDFKKLDHVTEMGKETGVTIVVGYDSFAAPNDVKNFYVKELTTRGWTLLEDKTNTAIIGSDMRHFTFGKDGYLINIEHKDGSQIYYVGYVWNRP